MKKLYWRPTTVSNKALFLITLFALFGWLFVEYVRVDVKQRYYRDKMAASQLALDAMRLLKTERLKIDPAINPEWDPAQSGMIGRLISPITSFTGHLGSKQTSVNPNFAAVVVEFLKKAKVKEGDAVAVGLSGSFPAINVAVYAALKALKLKPVVISSVAASQWGANLSKFSWLDMERVLFENNVFPFRSVAVSMGGMEDKGLGMTKPGKKMLKTIAMRNGFELLKPDNYAHSVQLRMQIYQQQAAGVPYRAYINVGGGTTSVGRRTGKWSWRAGLNTKIPFGLVPTDSVIAQFIADGTTAIHLVRINQLAAEYGFPIAPTQMTAVGEGTIYVRKEYNRPMAVILLVLITGSLYIFIRSDLGFRLFQQVKSKKKVVKHPQQMV